MARSNRRRKQDRAKREARASRKRAVSQRRREAEESIRVALERYDRIVDPATPLGELASLLAGNYGGEPVSAALAERMLEAGSPAGRLAQAADVMLAADPLSLTALTFAAGTARAAGDTAAARRLLDQALSVASDAETGDPGLRMELARHLQVGGRLADAVELAEARLRDEPGDDYAAERYGSLMQDVHARVNGAAPDTCPCGLGSRWQECCGPRERAALARFADRSGLAALQDAVSAYASASDLGPVIEQNVAESLSFTEDLDWEPAERARFAALAAESALVTVGSPEEDEADGAGGGPEPPGLLDEGDVDGGDVDAGDADAAMGRFAADPSVPAGLAARAAAWDKHIHYGLWRVDDEPDPAPGLWCTDIISGVTRYAEFPGDLSDGTPRWAVWLGGMVPDDGIWRCTGHGMWLSPAEADAAAELVHGAYAALASELTGKRKRRSRAADEPMRFGRAEPIGVYVDYEEAAPDLAASFLSAIAASLVTRIAAEVHAYRRTPPGLCNTDGDEMCLITAQIKVRDGVQAAARLSARTDFDGEPDPGRGRRDPLRLVWLGRQIPDGERAALLAEARAQLRLQGLGDVDVDNLPETQRWVRGSLQFRGDQIEAEVNSRERLAGLLGILTKIGAEPVVTDEVRAAPAAEGWEKHWLDEKVPALRGQTPRQAAAGKGRLLLEGMLRQFEYEADLVAARGEHGVDTAWLRRELGMRDHLALSG